MTKQISISNNQSPNKKTCLFGYLHLVFAEAPHIKGFLQSDYSVRITGAKLQGAKRHELMLGEERGRLEGSFYPSNTSVGFDVKGDLFHDWVADSWGVRLREGYMDYL